MEKKYEKIEFNCGCTIANAVLELIKHGVDGKFVCGDFNGHTLYSDTVSLDSACLEIAGKTYFDGINAREQRREKLIKEEEEYQKTVPTQTQLWIDEGHKILDKKYWVDWDKCVPIRLSDLYHGMELKCCLDIVKELNNGCSIEKAKEIINSQDHSGMSFGLVRSMVTAFCNRGVEFMEYVKY